MATASLEDVAAAGAGAGASCMMFQLYVIRDWELTRRLVQGMPNTQFFGTGCGPRLYARTFGLLAVHSWPDICSPDSMRGLVKALKTVKACSCGEGGLHSASRHGRRAAPRQPRGGCPQLVCPCCLSAPHPPHLSVQLALYLLHLHRVGGDLYCPS